MVVETLGFIVAGHDTTSTTLCWGVKLLADHPKVQRRVRDDLQAAFPEAKAERRLPSVSEITKASVPYLEATMEEILRVGNTVPIVDRDAIQDTTILGHFVPKGTHVFFLNTGPSFLEPAFDIDESLRSPQARDSKVGAWAAEDIAVFKPERWLGIENGREVFNSQAGPINSFGLGLRGCYGRRLAYLELRLLLTVLLWKFEFQSCPESLSSYDAVDGVVHGPKKCYVRLSKVVS
jgi:cytochrome P450